MARVPLTIACVYQANARTDFGVGYIIALKRGIARHLKVPYCFVCLSNSEVPCERIPLEHDWPGWWSKIELLKLPPPVLYFDLDTIIVGDLGDISAHAIVKPMIVLRDFYREKGIGSGMMSWASDMTWLYDNFASAPEFWMDKHKRLGDQGYLEEVLDNPSRWQDTVPGQVLSYKADVARVGISEDARVVCFHGRPRPAQLPQDHFLREHWH